MNRLRLVEPLNLLVPDAPDDMRRALLAARVTMSNDGGRFRFIEEERNTPLHAIDVEPLDARGSPRTDGFHIRVQIGEPSGPIFDRWYGAANPLEEAIAFGLDALDGVVPVEAEPAPDDADLAVLGLAWRIIDGLGDAVAVVRRATPWSGVSIVYGTLGEPEPSVFLGAPPRRLVSWRRHHPADRAELDVLEAMRPGTLVRAHAKRPELLPASLSISTETADPVARMRALAAWAAFRDARP